MVGRFRIEPLASTHKHKPLESGSALLDRYFREQAAQDVRRRIATCFVAVEIATEAVAGYYTLAATSLVLDALAPNLARKLPRYPIVPAVLLGRLAVVAAYQRQGLGSALLANALRRAAAAELGVYAMVVDAKDDAARRFYEHYGFALLPGYASKLVLPIATALKFLPR